jgi:hypothetical protein
VEGREAYKIPAVTGSLLRAVHVNDFGSPWVASLPHLADILHRQVYQTGAFGGSIVLDSEQEN